MPRLVRRIADLREAGVPLPQPTRRRKPRARTAPVKCRDCGKQANVPPYRLRPRHGAPVHCPSCGGMYDYCPRQPTPRPVPYATPKPPRKKRKKGAYQKRDALLRRLGFHSYDEYLASDLWEGIRLRALLRDGHRCILCGQPAHTVHHRKYTRATLKGTTLKHLASVCTDCHQAVEFENGHKRRFREADKQFVQLCSHARGETSRASTCPKSARSAEQVALPELQGAACPGGDDGTKTHLGGHGVN